MAKKKNNGDLSTIISKPFFDSLTKLTQDNYIEFLKSESMFFIVSLVKNKAFVVLNSFYNRKIMTKGFYIFKFYCSDEIHSIRMNVKADESVDDYNDMVKDVKTIIKNEIKNNRLYGLKI